MEHIQKKPSYISIVMIVKSGGASLRPHQLIKSYIAPGVD